jgi:hypothetical protein
MLSSFRGSEEPGAEQSVVLPGDGTAVEGARDHPFDANSTAPPATLDFCWDADSVYRAIIGEYDKSFGFDRAWLSRVSQHYKEHQTMAVAKAKGTIFRAAKSSILRRAARCNSGSWVR